MIRRDHSFAVALCVSLVAHAGMVLVLVGRALDDLRLAKPAPLAASQPDPHSPIYLAQPAPPADLLFGDQAGAGEAANSAAGEEPMIGRDAGQTQAFLSRDPIGAGHVGDDPSMSVLPRNPSPNSGSSPPDQAATFGLREEDTAQTPRVRHALSVGLTTPEPAATNDDAPIVATPAAPAPRLSAEEAQPSSPASPASPASAAPAADPAVMSDSESDPFAHGNRIEFRDGRVDVRFGRKVKTLRPRLSLAARYDLLGMQSPRMVVRLHVEASGDVRRVDITQSTGSESADQDVKVALYQWWVEPPKNPRGVALADVVEFPILWR